MTAALLQELEALFQAARDGHQGAQALIAELHEDEFNAFLEARATASATPPAAPAVPPPRGMSRIDAALAARR
jgi:hypothetical protein